MAMLTKFVKVPARRLWNGHLPRITFPVLDKGMAWDLLDFDAETGYCLQQHKLLKNARVVDRSGWPSMGVAWGTLGAMEEAYCELIDARIAKAKAQPALPLIPAVKAVMQQHTLTCAQL